MDTAAAQTAATREEAAHEKRNWVRLTYDCNNHCVFCLDTLTHDGQMRDREEVKRQILDGRKGGAERLILSGGEPTIHPHFVDFVRLGRMAGYPKIQTVTNGRLFGYPEFLARALDAGLSEITFSIHGPNARIHDALVGVKGAYEQEIQGLDNALAAARESGRLVVNVDIVINRGNVRHLREMLDGLYARGVREFDLLQVIPFGNAFTEGRDVLFYDLDEMRPHLLAALEYADRPDVHIWMNRFPVKHLEGYERLIQDPYKLTDEVRGRKEEYAHMLYEGGDLDCRQPERCRYCYLEHFCDSLYALRDAVQAHKFSALRVDSEWEAQQKPVFGGDPASAKRARMLPIIGQLQTLEYVAPEVLAEGGAIARLIVRAPNVEAARAVWARFPDVGELELELADYAALDSALLDGKRLVRVTTGSVQTAERLLQMAGDFEVRVILTRATAPWLLSLREISPRLALLQPSYERLTEAAENDVAVQEFFAAFTHALPVDGLPACVTGRVPRDAAAILDTANLLPDGRIEVFRYTQRYVLERYYSQSLRCRGCAHEKSCRGLHINFVRAHGFDAITPERVAAIPPAPHRA